MCRYLLRRPTSGGPDDASLGRNQSAGCERAAARRRRRNGDRCDTRRLGPLSAPKEILWPHGVAPAGATPSASTPSASQYNNLIFHGGAVQHHPRVHITYWGTEWKNGFHTGSSNAYSSSTAMNYVTKFLATVGGSPWNGGQTQYCDNITPGSTSCAGQPFAQYVANSAKVLGGVWVDPTPAPATIATTGLAENLTNDPIATEAVKAEKHFGYDIDATYFVFTPPGHAATAYGTVYCAYHSEVTNIGGHGIRYAFMPSTPEQGAGCGGNSVNKPGTFPVPSPVP